MKRKILKFLPVVVIAVFFLSSVTVEKLDEVKAKAGKGKFDASLFAEKLWNNELIPNLPKAVEASHLIELLQRKPDSAFKEFSRTHGIGNIRFFMIRGEGEIRQIRENDITVMVTSGSSEHVVHIATEYIFGNAVRDASGHVDIQEFDQTMDFNNVSAEINQLVRKKVLPHLKNDASLGKKISFAGAIELNKEQMDLQNIEVIPVQVEFLENRSVHEK